MTMDREKERERELENVMYTNCLLLGLDRDIIGVETNNGNPRVGLFSHSNPKLGEQLLHFILSSLRGPIQSVKDFDKVWPIFDSSQSRDFWKVAQGIISELESQGALPRNDLRVSLLVTCCGPRFVELLWRLSLLALREVHKRTYAVDMASNPLPAPFTDIALSHAVTLLPVTKARIALERRRFLKNAETAVQKQALWSNFVVYLLKSLQQELEKLHELVSTCSYNAHIVQRATHLWDFLLSQKSKYEVLAPGTIEDLIVHHERRYSISGSSLLAAMGQNSLDPFSNLTPHNLDNEETEGSQAYVNNERRCQPTVDVAEVLQRWTHALQRIHKQSLQLAKANDGEGPDLLSRSDNDGSSSHAESLTETLAEHRQHLNNMQVLINQLKDVAPTIQNSISELMDEVNRLPYDIPPAMKLKSNSPIQAQSSGRALERNDGNVDMTSRLSSVQLEKVADSPPSLKLPPLFSSTPNSSGKGGNMQKQQTVVQINPIETITYKNSLEQPPNSHVNNQHDEDIKFLQNLKRSVREVALSSRLCNLGSSQDSHSDGSSEHLFVPLSGTGFSRLGQYIKHDAPTSGPIFTSQEDSSMLQIHANQIHQSSKYSGTAYMLNDLDSLEYYGVNGFLSANGSNSPVSDTYRSFFDIDEAQDQVFSPPLLLDAAIFFRLL